MSGPDEFCRAVSQPGALVNLYGLGPLPVPVTATKARNFACTQDPDHAGSHSACDGQGHVLARWPRAAVERYWQPADCAGHSHEPAAKQ